MKRVILLELAASLLFSFMLVSQVAAQGCVDKKVLCPTLIGWCPSLPDVRNDCPKTCNTCPVTSTTCSDGRADCPTYKSFCEANIQVKALCKKTCGLCDNSGGFSNYGDWNDWSECSKNCGGGLRERTRDCNGPQQCTEELRQEEDCNPQPCGECKDNNERCSGWGQYCDNNDFVINNCKKTCGTCQGGGGGGGVWGDWSDWSDCSVACGEGERERTRTCQTAPCSGSDREVESCTGTDCSSEPCEDKDERCKGWDNYCGRNTFVDENCKQMCGHCRVAGGEEYSDWLDWSDCSVACGKGTQQRSRTCLSAPCTQPLSETRDCEGTNCGVECKDARATSWCERLKHRCNGGISPHCRKTCGICDVAGPKYSNWGDWPVCSMACGKGTQARSRTCEVGPCTESLVETRACEGTSCAAWGDWSDWGKCTKSCGGGIQERTRECNILNGCTGQSTETRDCNAQACEVECKDARATHWCENRKHQCNGGVRPHCRKTCGDCDQGYGNWGEWSECSLACGGGQRTRTRPCLISPCVGDSQQTESCNVQECEDVKCEDTDPGCPNWKNFCESNNHVIQHCILTCGKCTPTGEEYSTWSEWNSCSVNCGKGTQQRTRTCLSAPCTQTLSETRDCEETNCQWNDWGDWTACSAECGGGVKQRTRTCSVPGQCDGPSLEQISCNSDGCEWNNWELWGDCTEECGGGTRQRSRTCPRPGQCSGPSQEQRACNTDPCDVKCEDTDSGCPNWKNFCESNSHVIKHCILTCGKCTPMGEEYSTWSEWNSCSVNCGKGTQQRTRTCLSAPCTQTLSETRDCEGTNCPVCKDNRATHWCENRKHLCSGGVRPHCRKTCGDCDQGYGDWGEWSSCGLTCGGGESIRTRPCLVSPCVGESEQKQSCNEQACPEWSAYGAWSDCTEICGGGAQERTRTCSIPGMCNGQSTETRVCNDFACLAWKNWEAWEDCSKTCGPGDRTRIRKCPIANRCKGVSEQTGDCNDGTCPGWLSWGNWGNCDVKCGTGKQIRTRQCNVGTGCAGDSTEDKACTLDPCPEWTKWNEWGSCTESCGDGTQKRTRTCKGGSQDECPGSPEETRSCRVKDCPKWRNWADWSTCSKNCGGGTTQRTRVCEVVGECGTDNKETKTCNSDSCLTWKQWGAFDKCTRSCGGGTQKRTRECPIVNRCEGEDKQSQNCNVQQCQDPSQWTPCSNTCGEGTRRRLTGGEWQFQSCNDKTCPLLNCNLQNVRNDNRYTSWTSCCAMEHKPAGQQCGQPVTLNQRIIGGVASKAKQWPWMVGYQVGGGFCAGSLISMQWVVTAAHCVTKKDGSPMLSDFSSVRVVAGIIDLNYYGSATHAFIDRVIIHRDYNYPESDIALIKLKTALPYNEEIRPICLPNGEITPEDTECYIMGWGMNTTSVQQITLNLQEVGIMNYSPLACAEAFGNDPGLSHHQQFAKTNPNYLCAGSLTKKIDSCKGDSGGPMVCQRCTSCSWYLAGVVSFGAFPCAAPKTPAVYTKVVNFESWIAQHSGITLSSLSCS